MPTDILILLRDRTPHIRNVPTHCKNVRSFPNIGQKHTYTATARHQPCQEQQHGSVLADASDPEIGSKCPQTVSNVPAHIYYTEWARNPFAGAPPDGAAPASGPVPGPAAMRRRTMVTRWTFHRHFHMYLHMLTHVYYQLRSDRLAAPGAKKGLIRMPGATKIPLLILERVTRAGSIFC